MNADAPAPRELCLRCERPTRVCWCAHVPTIPTTTRVVIFQHPREQHMPIGTARMASLSLPSSHLFVGIGLDERSDVRALLEDPEKPAVLLYPGPDAGDLDVAPPEGPVTLVVLDGTWAHARKLLRKNPRVAALPRYSFRPPAPSEYRIRSEPKRDYVSTIEAIAHALTRLEKSDFSALYEPFRAMVNAQLLCEMTRPNTRGRHARSGPSIPKTPRPLREIRAKGPRLVCVIAEANAWPYDQPDSPPDELIQWLAVRPSTGETLDLVVAPRRALAPATSSHTRLREEELRAGVSLDELASRWRDFSRDDDILCSWGYYGASLLAKEGLPTPAEYMDLRLSAASYTRARPGALDAYLGSLGLPDAAPIGRGRGGERMGQLVAILEVLLASNLPRSADRDPVAMVTAP